MHSNADIGVLDYSIDSLELLAAFYGISPSINSVECNLSTVCKQSLNLRLDFRNIIPDGPSFRDSTIAVPARTVLKGNEKESRTQSFFHVHISIKLTPQVIR